MGQLIRCSIVAVFFALIGCRNSGLPPPGSSQNGVPIGEIYYTNSFSQTGANPQPAYPGHQGDKGPQGDKGLDGEKGGRGDKGPDGDRGLQGERGTAGAPGHAGEEGAKGDKGGRGEQGLTGDKGPPGDKGTQGDKGIQGDKGLLGDRGTQGDIGPRGDKGPRGDAGPRGDNGLDGNAGQPSKPLNKPGSKDFLTGVSAAITTLLPLIVGLIERWKALLARRKTPTYEQSRAWASERLAGSPFDYSEHREQVVAELADEHQREQLHASKNDAAATAWLSFLELVLVVLTGWFFAYLVFNFLEKLLIFICSFTLSIGVFAVCVAYAVRLLNESEDGKRRDALELEKLETEQAHLQEMEITRHRHRMQILEAKLARKNAPTEYDEGANTTA